MWVGWVRAWAEPATHVRGGWSGVATGYPLVIIKTTIIQNSNQQSSRISPYPNYLVHAKSHTHPNPLNNCSHHLLLITLIRRLLLLLLLIIFSSHHHVFFSISNYYCKPRSYNFTNMIPEVV
jgi:hypothetical protein